MTTRITLLGGVNEIGGNKFLLEEGDDRLLLDFGTSIGARGAFFEEFLQPRTNSVLRDLLRLGLLPDLDGIYREDFLALARAETDGDLPESAESYHARTGRPFVTGVLLTHAHVDHFQDLSFVDPSIPVYCTPTTHRMLRAVEDVANAGVQKEILAVRWRTMGASKRGNPKAGMATRPRDVREISEGRTHRVGSFEVVPVPVDHSIPGGVAFLIRTPRGKTIFYTGDIRFHGRLVDRTAALLKATAGLEPDVMLCEGTRIDHASPDNEEGVERGVTDLARVASGLVVAEFAWKDTTRFDTLQRVAEATGRTLVVDPRLAYLLHQLRDRPDVPSRRPDEYANVRVYRRRKKSMMDSEEDYDPHELGYLGDWGKKELDRARAEKDEAWLALALAHRERGLAASDVRRCPEKYIVHLTFWSSAELFDLAPPAGSRWIRCATEPYSDEMAMDLRRQRNWLDHFGMAHNVREKKGADDPDVLQGLTHVSGHGGRNDLETLVRNARPKLLVPIHTSEKSLDVFESLGFSTQVFRGASFRDAGRGRCVVEI